MKHFFLAIFMLNLFSCESSVDIELNGETKLVVEAYLVSGDSLKVRISSSADITERNSKILDDLEFYILFNNQKHKLIYRYFDTFSSVYSLPTTIFSIPDEGILRFETRYGNQLVTGENNIPEVTKIDSYNIDFTRNTMGTIDVQAIDIYADFPVQNKFYLVELGVQQQVLYNNEIIDHNAIILRKYSEPETGLKKIHVDNSSSTGFGYFPSPLKESFVLHLYNLDSFHSEFYRAVQSQQNDGDGLSAIFGNNVTEIPSNIVNGYGIFTVMSPDTLRMEIK